MSVSDAGRLPARVRPPTAGRGSDRSPVAPRAVEGFLHGAISRTTIVVRDDEVLAPHRQEGAAGSFGRSGSGTSDEPSSDVIPGQRSEGRGSTGAATRRSAAGVPSPPYAVRRAPAGKGGGNVSAKSLTLMCRWTAAEVHRRARVPDERTRPHEHSTSTRVEALHPICASRAPLIRPYGPPSPARAEGRGAYRTAEDPSPPSASLTSPDSRLTQEQNTNIVVDIRWMKHEGRRSCETSFEVWLGMRCRSAPWCRSWR